MKKDKTTKSDILSLIGNNFDIQRGKPLPFGATIVRGGINFAVYSPYAQSVWLVLFDLCEQEPVLEFPLDATYNRTGHVWHALVTGLDHGIKYGFRVRGSSDHNPVDERIVLLDPYARATCGGQQWGKPIKIERDGRKHTFRISTIPKNNFDWGLDAPLNIPLPDTIIYELHVRGYTVHPSSKVKHPGTFTALTQKIPYLKELGVTAVELMPVTDFDETANERINPKNGKKLMDFWGYNPLSFFAPKAAYAAKNENEHAILNEFRQMVKKFHQAGIEVILDMVFNHTGEGGLDGPVYHFKGFDNRVYYMIDPQTGEYLNFSGCGNTLNCNHPVVRDMILDSLRYWVMEMHVDGFRFDLASILGRGRNGEILSNPPLLERIAEDPILAKSKLIAEAWDAAGLYQVGDFPHFERWMEWNGRYRDDVRRFMRGDRGMVGAFATRLFGSADLYQDDGREPYHSVNFVTCHDGFTLHDLVSYNEKHNLENGEDNRDGTDQNFSWNCGVEGPSSDPEVLKLRSRQKRNFMTALLLSQGVPMLLAGDEFGRTQKGNNNAYCQDNEISWVNWHLARQNDDLLRFTRLLIRFRKENAHFRRAQFEIKTINGEPEVSWHGQKLNQPQWEDPETRWLGVLYRGDTAQKQKDVYLLFNASDQPRSFELPTVKSGPKWHLFINTANTPPRDIYEPRRAPVLNDQTRIVLQPFSSVVLIGR
ncbi:glycogen debranching protein GlgX [Caldithrix abyssi]